MLVDYARYQRKIIGNLLVREVEKTSNGGCVVRGTWEGKPPLVGDELACSHKRAHIRGFDRPEMTLFLFSKDRDYFKEGEVWQLRV